MNLLFANDRRGAYPDSWYAATADLPAPKPRLKGQREVEVCVIGAGYTGLSAALHLAEAGHKVLVVEAQRVGFGASGRNGGHVGTGLRLDQITLERMVGHEQAHVLWSLGLDARAIVTDLIDRHGIAADFRPGIIYAENHARDVPDAAAYARHLQVHYDYDQIEPLDRDGVQALVKTPAYHGGVLDRGAGHLHPLKYVLGLARAAEEAGAEIVERTQVLEIRRGGGTYHVQTDLGAIRAPKVILACNGYLGGLNRAVAARVMPINSFIAATEPLGDRAAEFITQDHAVSDSKFVVNYFRLSHDRRLIFGGGESYGYRFPPDIAAVVRKPMVEIFPQARELRIDYAWGGTLAITRSRLPHFAELEPGLWSASGFSGHGVALATLAGKLLAQAAFGPCPGFDALARLKSARFPGGPAMRSPLLALAMHWFALRDKIGR